MFDKPRLGVNSLGLALGVTYGLGMLFIGLLAALFGWWTEIITLAGKLYIGFEPTIPGSIIGGIYGFIDGYICGALIAWLYNKFQK